MNPERDSHHLTIHRKTSEILRFRYDSLNCLCVLNEICYLLELPSGYLFLLEMLSFNLLVFTRNMNFNVHSGC